MRGKSGRIPNPPRQSVLPQSSQTASLPPSQTRPPARFHPMPTTPIRMASPQLPGSHHSSPSLGFAPFSPGGLSYAPNSPCLSQATVSTRQQTPSGSDDGDPNPTPRRLGVHPGLAQYLDLRNRLKNIDHRLSPEPQKRTPTPASTLRLTVRPADALQKFSGDRAEILASLIDRNPTWAGVKGIGCKAGTLWLNFVSEEAMQSFQRSEDPFAEELCCSLESKARDLEKVLNVKIDTFKSSEQRYHVEIKLYGAKIDRSMRGRRDWFEEPFGIQVYSVTVRWSRLIVSFDDVEQAWKLLQAYETAQDDFYVNYRLAAARPIDIRAIIIFCSNCGRPWHLADSCRFPRRCHHFTKDHSSNECPFKDNEKQKQCGNCPGRHSVTSARCLSEQVAMMKLVCSEYDRRDVDWYVRKRRSIEQRPRADAPQYVDLTGSTESSLGDNGDMYDDSDLDDSDFILIGDSQTAAVAPTAASPSKTQVKGTSNASTSSTISSTCQPLAPENANASPKSTESSARQPLAPKNANASPKSTESSARQPLAPKNANTLSNSRSNCNKAKMVTSAPAPKTQHTAAGKDINGLLCKEGTRKRLASLAMPGSNPPRTRARTDARSSISTGKAKSSRSERRRRLQERIEKEKLSSNQKDTDETSSNKQKAAEARSSRKTNPKPNNRGRATATMRASRASPVITAPTPSVQNTGQPSPVASSGEDMVKDFGMPSPASIQSLDNAARRPSPKQQSTRNGGDIQPPLPVSSLTESAAASFTRSNLSFTGNSDSPCTGPAGSFTGISGSIGSVAALTGSADSTAPSSSISSSFSGSTTSRSSFVPTILPPCSSLIQASNARSFSSIMTPARSGNVAQPATPTAPSVIVNECRPYRVSKPSVKGVALSEALSGTVATALLTPSSIGQPSTVAPSSVPQSGSRQKTVNNCRNPDQTPCPASRASRILGIENVLHGPSNSSVQPFLPMWPGPKGSQSTRGDDGLP